jgi:hypothetical protein
MEHISVIKFGQIIVAYRSVYNCSPDYPKEDVSEKHGAKLLNSVIDIKQAHSFPMQ